MRVARDNVVKANRTGTGECVTVTDVRVICSWEKRMMHRNYGSHMTAFNQLVFLKLYWTPDVACMVGHCGILKTNV